MVGTAPLPLWVSKFPKASYRACLLWKWAPSCRRMIASRKPTLSPHFSFYLFLLMAGWMILPGFFVFLLICLSSLCRVFRPYHLATCKTFPSNSCIPVLDACLGQISLSCLLSPTQLCEMSSLCHVGSGASQFFMLGLLCFWRICVLAASCAWSDFKLFEVYLCCIFLSMVASICLSAIRNDCSGRLGQDWYTTFVVGIFQIFDVVGRSTPQAEPEVLEWSCLQFKIAIRDPQHPMDGTPIPMMPF